MNIPGTVLIINTNQYLSPSSSYQPNDETDDCNHDQDSNPNAGFENTADHFTGRKEGDKKKQTAIHKRISVHIQLLPFFDAKTLPG
jgi:hypothetical protein